jgi:hypothetical protein
MVSRAEFDALLRALTVFAGGVRLVVAGRVVPALGGASVGYVAAFRPAGRPDVHDAHAVVGFEAATLVEAGAVLSLLGLAVAVVGFVLLLDVRTVGDTPNPTADD